jgi:hypothetical protein
MLAVTLMSLLQWRAGKAPFVVVVADVLHRVFGQFNELREEIATLVGIIPTRRR